MLTFFDYWAACFDATINDSKRELVNPALLHPHSLTESNTCQKQVSKLLVFVIYLLSWVRKILSLTIYLLFIVLRYIVSYYRDSTLWKAGFWIRKRQYLLLGKIISRWQWQRFKIALAPRSCGQYYWWLYSQLTLVEYFIFHLSFKT